MENNEDKLTIGFNIAELQIINLKPNDVLAVKLIGDDFDANTMESLRDSLTQVFTKNKVMVFTMPTNTGIVFEAIRQDKTISYCSDCNCGKKDYNEEEAFESLSTEEDKK
jgi:hypothetical protein